MSDIETVKTRLPARQQVLETTLDLFSRDGFFNTSVHDIARESGVSVGSIYHHFKDKQGVAMALYNSLLERMNEQLMQIHRSSGTAHGRCYAVIRLLFEMTEQEPQVMEFMLHSRHREFLSDQLPVCSAAPFKLMREMVAEGVRNGEIRALDPMVASSSVYGGALRMVTSRLDGLIRDNLMNYLDDVWACAWRSVSAEAG